MIGIDEFSHSGRDIPKAQQEIINSIGILMYSKRSTKLIMLEWSHLFFGKLIWPNHVHDYWMSDFWKRTSHDPPLRKLARLNWRFPSRIESEHIHVMEMNSILEESLQTLGKESIFQTGHACIDNDLKHDLLNLSSYASSRQAIEVGLDHP